MTELGVIALLTLIVLLVVVRPMVRRVIAPDLLLPGGPKLAIATNAAPALSADPSTTPDAIEHTRRVQDMAIQVGHVAEVAKNHPREAAAVLRNWIAEK